MKSSKVLEMLIKGYVEELKAELKDEIYKESLKTKPNAKKRYTAMKKYFTYVTSVREACSKPAIVEFEGWEYTSFCNSYSLVLTTESCGEMVMFDPDKGNYPDVTRLIRFDGEEDKIDISDVIARAKAQGYKLKRDTVMNNHFLMKYKGNYFRIGLLDSTFGVIDDGEEATIYCEPVSNRPITITNDLGICVIMPVRIDGELDDGTVVIEV